jgi:hypothetical protein
LILVWSDRLSVDLLSLLLAILLSVGSSVVLCRAREELRFATPVARSMAFPPNRSVEGVLLRLNIALSLVFLLPSVAMLPHPLPFDSASNLEWTIFGAFMVGSFPFVGVLHHAVRRRVLRPAQPTADPHA